MNITQSNAKEKKYQKSIQFIKCLYNEFEDWIFFGLYIRKETQLEISDYYSDNIPCSPIDMNGVCGQSLTKKSVLIVGDVTKFKNHIICDINSKSEIAIPFTKNKKEYVLDVDSKKLNDFDQIDEKYLKKIIKEI